MTPEEAAQAAVERLGADRCSCGVLKLAGVPLPVRCGKVKDGVREPPRAVIAYRLGQCIPCEHNSDGVCMVLKEQKGSACAAKVNRGVRMVAAHCPLPEPKWEKWRER